MQYLVPVRDAPLTYHFGLHTPVFLRMRVHFPRFVAGYQRYTSPHLSLKYDMELWSGILPTTIGSSAFSHDDSDEIRAVRALYWYETGQKAYWPRSLIIGYEQDLVLLVKRNPQWEIIKTPLLA